MVAVGMVSAVTLPVISNSESERMTEVPSAETAPRDDDAVLRQRDVRDLGGHMRRRPSSSSACCERATAPHRFLSTCRVADGMIESLRAGHLEVIRGRTRTEFEFRGFVVE